MFYSKSKKMWIERFKLPNGKPKEISAKTERELTKKLVAFHAEVKNSSTFSAIADAWEVSREGKIDDKTAQSYAPHVRRAKDFFGDRDVKDITPDEVQAYVDSLVDRNYAKDTVRRGLVILNKIFKYAIVQPGAAIRINPCAAVEIPRGLRQTRREPPEPEQIKKVNPDSEMGLFAFFLLWSGLRPEELLGLEYKNIDRENKVIHVRQVATYTGNQAVIKIRAKTEAGLRDVPLLDVLDNVLPRKTSGFVFGGEKPLSHTEFRKRWLMWCRDVGLAECIEETHTAKNKHKYTKRIWKPLVTPYQFRHEFASMLEDENVSEFDAQHIMGHSSIVITKDIYTHFREKKMLKKNAAAEKLNARASGKKSGET